MTASKSDIAGRKQVTILVSIVGRNGVWRKQRFGVLLLSCWCGGVVRVDGNGFLHLSECLMYLLVFCTN